MKKMTMCLTVGLAFCAALASADDAAVKSDAKIEQTAPGERLKSDYKVDDARIDGLRDKKYGYGEIKKVLALAEKMPGGITDENVNKIVALREGPPKMGWGQIAKQQGVHPGKLTGKGGEKSAEKAEKHEKSEKHEKHEKHEKAEKLEKAEKPEKAARPEKSHKH